MESVKIDAEKYYSVKELGGWLFSETTWRRRVATGEITHVKCKGVRILGKWIHEYLERSKIEAKIKNL